MSLLNMVICNLCKLYVLIVLVIIDYSGRCGHFFDHLNFILYEIEVCYLFVGLCRILFL